MLGNAASWTTTSAAATSARRSRCRWPRPRSFSAPASYWPRRPRRHLRAAAGQRRRDRPGADRAAVRRSRLRRPRSRGQPDPHPGAALSRPAIAAMTCTDGTVRRWDEISHPFRLVLPVSHQARFPNHSMASPEPWGRRTHVGRRI